MNREFSTLPGTVISFDGGGSQLIPKLTAIHGQLPESVDDGNGISVIYNYPQASYVTNWDGSPEYGHVIAPLADAVLTAGNFNGCVIANSLYSGSEGHLSPYKGGTIVGFYGKVKTTKTVDGEVPNDRQVFKFAMKHLRNAVPESEYNAGLAGGKTKEQIMWDYIGTTTNDHGSVEFDKVPFYEAGTYYFLVYESTDKQYPDITLDTTKYVVKVEVAAVTSGDNVVLSIDSGSLKYYKVTDEANLITVAQNVAAGEYRATINPSAMTLLTGVMTWENSILDTPIEFMNKEKKSGITIQKVVEGSVDTSEEFPFKLYVWFEDTNEQGNTVYSKCIPTGVKKNDEGVTFESSSYAAGSASSHPAGCVSFNLTEATPITFVGLPVGAHYAFVEDVENMPTGYAFVSKTNYTGEVPPEGANPVTVEFTNKYISAKANIKGTKAFNNGTIGENQFSFTIRSDDDDAPLPEQPKVYAQTDGSIAFGDMTYTMAMAMDGTKEGTIYTKTYTYNVVENAPSGYTFTEEDRTAGTKVIDGIKYDTSEKTVTVTVTYDKASNEMTATVSPETTQFTFTNEQLGELDITKNINVNGTIDSSKTGIFWYAVYRAEDVEKGAPKINVTPATDAEGNSLVGSIRVTANGTETKNIKNLYHGDYYVFELTGDPGSGDIDVKLIASGADGYVAVIGNTVYHVTGSGTTMATVGATHGTATLDNDVPDKDFHFTKEWWVNGKQEKEEAWPVNVTIPSFTLVRFLEYDGHTSANQDPNFSAVFANISESSTNIQPDNSSRVDGTNILLKRDGTGNGFKYTVTGLPKYGSMEDNGQMQYGEWKYRVSEAKVNGYNEPVYLDSQGNPKQGTSYAEDGEIIKNVLITVSLPATGGVGTGAVYGAGAAVILLALLGLVLMNRKRGRGTGI